MRVLETFEISGGLVVAVEAPTELPVAKRLSAIVTREDGTTVSATAYKEWLLHQKPAPIEGEAFLLKGLKKSDVPIGSEVALAIAPNPLGKAHSSIVAAEFKALGWTLAREFRADGDAEPYEYLFEWQREGEPAYPAR